MVATRHSHEKANGSAALTSGNWDGVPGLAANDVARLKFSCSSQ